MADLPTAAPVLVDVAWYLRTYPDVAAAGVDPQQHYLLHGRAERRLPRPLRALRLEDALWGGFARLALPELQAWLQQTADPDEQACAAWALARWYASSGQWPAAIPLLNHLAGPLPPWLDHPGPVLLGVEVLLRNDLPARAHQWLSSAIARHGLLPDFCLAAANARLLPRTANLSYHVPRAASVGGALAATGGAQAATHTTQPCEPDAATAAVKAPPTAAEAHAAFVQQPAFVGGFAPHTALAPVGAALAANSSAQAATNSTQPCEPEVATVAAKAPPTPRPLEREQHTLLSMPEAQLRLSWINHALTSGGLAPLGLRDPQAPLGLDNLQAHAPDAAAGTQASAPRISVIMPAFNAAAFIETALRSLLAQTWQNLEVLVVDDCSSDDTCARVAALASEDSRIRLLRQPRNLGAYAARNRGLREARGAFVANHDSDDWSHPQRLELMAKPLLVDAQLQACVADWVRTDSALHFQCWRIERGLIEPSVSTLLLRRDALERLGGWDEVRVAADHELRQRLIRLHGASAIAHVLPGVPLVFARQLPESLTMASQTHLRTLFFGLRRLYGELAETWHGMARKPDDLKLSPPQRAFPAPAGMSSSTPDIARYDWLLMSDLSAQASTRKTLQAVLQYLLGADLRVALLHWPDYRRPDASIAGALLEQAVQQRVDIVLAEQRLHVQRVLIVGRHLLAYPLDTLPALVFESCQVVDTLTQVRDLPARRSAASRPLNDLREAVSARSEQSAFQAVNEQPEPAFNTATATQEASQQPASDPQRLTRTGAQQTQPRLTQVATARGEAAVIRDAANFAILIPQPKEFDSVWYLQRYPDIRTANGDPWQHYLAHGAAEGREPGPDFNTAHYLAQCPQARTSGMPALLHYLQVGRQQGCEAGHPLLEGQLRRREGRPTLLLCAHAAELELFGAERCLLDVLDACAALALNVIVSVPSLINTPYMDALRARSLAVACVPHQPWQADNAPCARSVRRFVELIRSHAIELVHANTLTLREPLLAARQAGVPAFVHVHESPAHDPDLAASIGLPAEQIAEQVLARADHLLANSAFTARHFHKPGATHVVGNIVDAAAFDLPNALQPDGITAALISSNLPKKGLADLQALACLLARQVPNLRLLLIGPDNAHVAQLRQALSDDRVPGNLQIMPYANSPQAALAQANIVLNLSHCQETFGRTVLEGMAAGRPVVAYRHGAIAELIEDGVEGFLVAPGDVKAVAERLRVLCADPERIRRMGTAGRRKARSYNLARLSSELAQAYGRVFSRLSR